MNSIERQIARIEAQARYQLADTCRTCHGQPRLHILVPDPADASLPINTPTQCPACGSPLDSVRQVVGVSIEASDRMLTGSDGVVHRMYCPARIEEGGQ